MSSLMKGWGDHFTKSHREYSVGMSGNEPGQVPCWLKFLHWHPPARIPNLLLQSRVQVLLLLLFESRVPVLVLEPRVPVLLLESRVPVLLFRSSDRHGRRLVVRVCIIVKIVMIVISSMSYT